MVIADFKRYYSVRKNSGLRHLNNINPASGACYETNTSSITVLLSLLLLKMLTSYMVI